MMLMLALPLFVTQMRPSGATATLRGRVPTAISPRLAWLAPSKTLTLSLSWFTTQTRGVVAGSNATVDEAVGLVAVGAA